MMQRVAGFSVTSSYSSFLLLNRRVFQSSLTNIRNQKNPKRHSFDEAKDSGVQFLGSTSTKFSSLDSASTPGFHKVGGIICREVDIYVDKVGSVTVLEATAESQDDLVNSALLMDDDDDDESRNEGPTLNSGDPYGAVLWPAASATANYIMERNYISSDMSILELGAGTGLVSLAAALAGASQIMATDYEQIPLDLLQYASKYTNNYDNTMQTEDQKNRKEQLAKIQTSIFDICALDGDQPLPYADLVVAADIMYEKKTGRAMAHRSVEALRQGSRVIIGCSPGRPGRPAFMEELQKLGIMDINLIELEGTTCSGDRHDLICGKGSTSVSKNPKKLRVKLVDLDPTQYKDI